MANIYPTPKIGIHPTLQNFLAPVLLSWSIYSRVEQMKTESTSPSPTQTKRTHRPPIIAYIDFVSRYGTNLQLWMDGLLEVMVNFKHHCHGQISRLDIK
jgi:hypothetical protein